MNFSEVMFCENYLTSDFDPYKHCLYFKPVCLLVKMASKTVIRPISQMLVPFVALVGIISNGER